jgi:hypothetical protein
MQIDSYTIKLLVEEQVASFSLTQTSFTAYDITKALRSVTGEFIPHSAIKPLVSEMFKNNKMSNYTRELGNFPGVGKQPWVYKPIPTDTGIFRGNTPIKLLCLPEDANTKIAKVDTFSRICISAKLITSLGLKAGDLVNCFYNDWSKQLILCEHTPNIDGLEYVRLYVVNKDNLVRLCKTTVQRLTNEPQVFWVKLNEADKQILVTIKHYGNN